MLRAAGVNDQEFVSLSDYYYEHQDRYLAAFYESRQRGHDLAPILGFAQGAIASRCNRLADEILNHNKRVLCREFARSLFGKLRSQRRRALGERQFQIIRALLDSGSMIWTELFGQVWGHYTHLKHGQRAVTRDLSWLSALGAIVIHGERLSIDPNWLQNLLRRNCWGDSRTCPQPPLKGTWFRPTYPDCWDEPARNSMCWLPLAVGSNPSRRRGVWRMRDRGRRSGRGARNGTFGATTTEVSPTSQHQ